MKLRQIISLLLLAVYLTAGWGYALSVTLCHCSHSDHFQEFHASSHHCCSACASAHRSIHEGDSIVDATCGCHHNHSNEIDLYDISRNIAAVTAPTEQPAMIATIDKSEIEFDNVILRLGVQLKIPLPDDPAKATSALRAPPALV
ncbi:MAG: hypothetical protein J6R09_05395 [Alistipes sp.]|nr:hypothetical protein [Alistipes sp.]